MAYSNGYVGGYAGAVAAGARKAFDKLVGITGQILRTGG